MKFREDRTILVMDLFHVIVREVPTPDLVPSENPPSNLGDFKLRFKVHVSVKSVKDNSNSFPI